MNENPYEGPKPLERPNVQRTRLSRSAACPVCRAKISVGELFNWAAIQGRGWPCSNCRNELRIRSATASLTIVSFGFGLLLGGTGFVASLVDSPDTLVGIAIYSVVLGFFSFLIPWALLSGGIASDVPPTDGD